MEDSKRKSAAKDKHVHVFPQAMLRTPILSYQGFLDLAGSLDKRRMLQERIQEPLVMRALRLHSPSLHEALEKQLAKGAPLSDELYTALYRYYSRMTTRATPLTLFAGVSAVAVGEYSSFTQAPRTRWQHALFVSFANMVRIARGYVGDPILRQAARFRINETTMQKGGVICYFTSEEPEGSDALFNGYKIISMRYDKQLGPLISDLGKSWTWDELAKAISAEVPDAAAELVEQYLYSMIDVGFLQHSFLPPTTGFRPEEYYHHLFTSQLPLHAATSDIESMFQRTQHPFSVAEDTFDASWEALAQHPWIEAGYSKRDGSSKEKRSALPMQSVLLMDSGEGGIPAKIMEKVGRCILRLPGLWQRMGKSLLAYRSAMRDFLQQGTVGSRIPLLDMVFEVAKGPNLLEKRNPAQGGRSPEDDDGSLDGLNRKYTNCIREKILQAQMDQLEEIEIVPKDLPPVSEGDRFEVSTEIVETFFQLVKHREETTALMPSASTRPGILMNRFLNWEGRVRQVLLGQLQNIWAEQQQLVSPAILAELTCSGGGRAVDLSLRPQTYPWQVVVNAEPSVSKEWQIPVNELSVTLEASEPILWWERKGCPVIGRQLSALSRESFSIVVCCILALDSRAASWGFPLPAGDVPVSTPRIVSEGIILAPKSWLLPSGLLSELKKPRKEQNADWVSERFKRWRDHFQVPRFVRPGKESNVLDLDVPHIAQELATLAERNQPRVWEEFLPASGYANGESGPLICEVVGHLKLENQKVESAGIAVSPSPLPAGRSLLQSRALKDRHSFSPGSPWLFFKLYFGPGLGSEARTWRFLEDDLLGRWLGPLMQSLEDQGAISDFHFVRYNDPEAHLRLRLRAAAQHSGSLLENIRAKLDEQVRNRAIDRWVIDTYEREVDRYGGEASIEIVERLFTAESRLSLAGIRQMWSDTLEEPLDADFEAPTVWPIRTIHSLLRAFEMNLNTRQAFLKILAHSWEKEFPMEGSFKSKLDKLLKEKRPLIQSLLAKMEGIQMAGLPEMAEREETRSAFERFYQEAQTAAQAIRKLEQEGRLTRSIESILHSVIHLHCVRLLGDREREATIHALNDKCCYSFLARVQKDVLR